MNKCWVFPDPIPDAKVLALAQALNVLPLTARILIHRGLESEEDARRFYLGTGLRMRHFSDVPGATKAGERLAQAVRQNEKIFIFGDYDVDGITSSAALYEFLCQRGARCEVYLPNRMQEGYGLSLAVIDRAQASGCSLLVTVDCGTTARQEVEHARQCGLDVIITDHHEPGQNQVDAETLLVNPKATGPADLAMLAGVGVTLQVIRATADALGEKDPEQLRHHLDLVALGTVADVVPMLGENRLLTRAGLAVINRGGRLGLKTLAKAAGLEQPALSSTDLAFRLGPRINAAGRLGDARAALDLLLSKNAEQAETLADFLNEQNGKRQSVEQEVIAEADQLIQAIPELPNVIVVAKSGWPIGVVGLAASRLCEKYYRPCFVLTESQGLAKGSGRSIAGFSLPGALESAAKFLIRWGGHDMAAGVTLNSENIPAFIASLQAFGDKMSLCDLKPSLAIDAEITAADINNRLLAELKRFEPFGFQNPKPMLALSKVQVSQPPRIVGERHLKFRVSQGANQGLDVIGFGLGSRVSEVAANNFVDLVGHASENVWNGSTVLQLELKDFRKTSNV